MEGDQSLNSRPLWKPRSNDLIARYFVSDNVVERSKAVLKIARLEIQSPPISLNRSRANVARRVIDISTIGGDWSLKQANGFLTSTVD